MQACIYLFYVYGYAQANVTSYYVTQAVAFLFSYVPLLNYIFSSMI